jgi:hypothetical protein
MNEIMNTNTIAIGRQVFFTVGMVSYSQLVITVSLLVPLFTKIKKHIKLIMINRFLLSHMEILLVAQVERL